MTVDWRPVIRAPSSLTPRMLAYRPSSCRRLWELGDLKNQLAEAGAGVWDLCLCRTEGVSLFINALPLLEEETQGSGTICNTDFSPG